MAKWSQSIEDYVKAIYQLAEGAPEGGGVSGSAIAERLRVSQASVTAMLKRLAELGLADYAPYKGVSLTLQGERIALEVIRHHRLIELYLFEALGMPWDEVHAEAEVLEHHISRQLGQRIAEKLGNPEFDPHGDPIPGVDGAMPAHGGLPLSALAEGAAGTIRRVRQDDPDVLRYLTEIGLTIGQSVTVHLQAPFGGPVTIETPTGDRHAVGRPLAARIDVEPLTTEVPR